MHLVKSHAHPETPAKSIHHPALKRIAVSTQDGIMLVRWQDISHCIADSNYARISLSDGTRVLVSKPLGRLQEILPTRYFMRVHQSYLVALDAIRRVGRDTLVLAGDVSIPLSRSGRKVLMERIREISEQL